jgi:hypothetical protein
MRLRTRLAMWSAGPGSVGPLHQPSDIFRTSASASPLSCGPHKNIHMDLREALQTQPCTDIIFIFIMIAAWALTSALCHEGLTRSNSAWRAVRNLMWGTTQPMMLICNGPFLLCSRTEEPGMHTLCSSLPCQSPSQNHPVTHPGANHSLTLALTKCERQRKNPPTCSGSPVGPRISKPAREASKGPPGSAGEASKTFRWGWT